MKSQSPTQDWAQSEFEYVQLGDARLKSRLIQITDRFCESPESPINQACPDWAEAKAAYRFFKNEKVEPSEILGSHVEKTVERAKNYSLILAIQDTCYLNYNNHKKTQGLGVIARIGNRSNSSRLGLIMHTAFAVTPDGLPLGILDQTIFARKPAEKKIQKLKEKTHCKGVRIEDKESYIWIDSLQKTIQSMGDHATQVVTVGDREADIYEVFSTAHSMRSSILIRAVSNRSITENFRYPRKRNPLWAYMQGQPCHGKIHLKIPSRNGIKERVAHLELRYSPVKFSPPKCSDKRYELPDVNLYAVYLIERHPPQGVKPLEWMLLTDQVVQSEDSAIEKVRWYALRWRIEIFHKVLKSGFRIEECRLETADRLIRYLSVMSIVAWRIYWINLIGRSFPNFPSTSIFSEEELKVLYSKIHRSAQFPTPPPTLRQAIHWLARLGGFLDRKGDGEPGVLSIWRGWKRLHDLIDGWNLGFTARTYG